MYLDLLDASAMTDSAMTHSVGGGGRSAAIRGGDDEGIRASRLDSLFLSRIPMSLEEVAVDLSSAV